VNLKRMIACGTPNSIANFFIPLMAVLNMDGGVVIYVCTPVFFAEAFSTGAGIGTQAVVVVAAIAVCAFNSVRDFCINMKLFFCLNSIVFA